MLTRSKSLVLKESSRDISLDKSNSLLSISRHINSLAAHPGSEIPYLDESGNSIDQFSTEMKLDDTVPAALDTSSDPKCYLANIDGTSSDFESRPSLSQHCHCAQFNVRITNIETSMYKISEDISLILELLKNSPSSKKDDDNSLKKANSPNSNSKHKPKRKKINSFMHDGPKVTHSQKTANLLINSNNNIPILPNNAVDKDMSFLEASNSNSLSTLAVPNVTRACPIENCVGPSKGPQTVEESKSPDLRSHLSHSIASILKNDLPELNAIQNCPNSIISNDKPHAKKSLYTREQCIIVKGIPELNKATPKELVNNDIKLVQDTISHLLRDNEAVQILKVFRIGTRNDNNNNYSRPVKIILENSSQANLLIERRLFLKTINPNIFFQQDYHPLERQKYRELYLELKSRKEKGETDIKIRNGVIVKFHRHYLWQNPILITKTP
jgi:hypothetical protein